MKQVESQFSVEETYGKLCEAMGLDQNNQEQTKKVNDFCVAFRDLNLDFITQNLRFYLSAESNSTPDQQINVLKILFMSAQGDIVIKKLASDKEFLLFLKDHIVSQPYLLNNLPNLAVKLAHCFYSMKENKVAKDIIDTLIPPFNIEKKVSIKYQFNVALNNVLSGKQTGIWLNYFKPDKSDLEILAEAIRVSSNLKLLSLHSCKINDEEFAVLSDALIHSNLKTLDLERNDITFTSVPNIIKLLEKNSLEEINISYNKLTSAGTKAILEALKSNTSVRSIDMRYSGYKDILINDAQETLKHNKTIQSISIMPEAAKRTVIYDLTINQLKTFVIHDQERSVSFKFYMFNDEDQKEIDKHFNKKAIKDLVTGVINLITQYNQEKLVDSSKPLEEVQKNFREAIVNLVKKYHQAGLFYSDQYIEETQRIFEEQLYNIIEEYQLSDGDDNAKETFISKLCSEIIKSNNAQLPELDSEFAQCINSFVKELGKCVLKCLNSEEDLSSLHQNLSDLIKQYQDGRLEYEATFTDIFIYNQTLDRAKNSWLPPMHPPKLVIPFFAEPKRIDFDALADKELRKDTEASVDPLVFTDFKRSLAAPDKKRERDLEVEESVKKRLYDRLLERDQQKRQSSFTDEADSNPGSWQDRLDSEEQDLAKRRKGNQSTGRE